MSSPISNGGIQGIIGQDENQNGGVEAKIPFSCGRITLIKSVLQTIPSFCMQSCLLPEGITNKMDTIMKDFFWGFDMRKKRHLHLKAWKDICRPREVGGLGIQRARDMNMAMVTKLNWQVCTKKNKVWVSLLKEMYLRGRGQLEFKNSHQSRSWIWRSIQHCAKLLKKGTCFQIGQRSRARIREDP